MRNKILLQKKTDKERESEALLMKTNPSGSRRMSNGSTWTENQKAEDASKLSSKSESFMNKIKATFDLDLLKNSTYLNVSLGCSLYYVAESNFKLMMPFFLSDIGECVLLIANRNQRTVAKDVYYSPLMNKIFLCYKRTNISRLQVIRIAHKSMPMPHQNNIVGTSMIEKTNILATTLLGSYIDCS